MKKSLALFTAIVCFAFFSSTFAQSKNKEWLAKDSWNFGFGFTYPYSININYFRAESNYGGYLSIQRNFSEHVGLRLRPNYTNLHGTASYKDIHGNEFSKKVTSSNIGADLDLIYYLSPVEPVSPYMMIGVGALYSSFTNPIPPVTKSSNFDWGMNIGFGSEWSINDLWKIKTEMAYHTISNTQQFGVTGAKYGGLLGTYANAYMTFDLGVLYYFDKGAPSKLNDLYSGIEPKIDYNRIEQIVKKYATKPTEVDYNRIEDIVKRHQMVSSQAAQRWVLLGVNFNFGKSSLRPESLPILYNAAEILLKHPDMNVEIQGYTDNIGSQKYNKKLSLARAQTVKSFLIAKGVDASRLSIQGFGEENPVASNKTADGRALNRRIEFKVK